MSSSATHCTVSAKRAMLESFAHCVIFGSASSVKQPMNEFAAKTVLTALSVMPRHSRNTRLSIPVDSVKTSNARTP